MTQKQENDGYIDEAGRPYLGVQQVLNKQKNSVDAVCDSGHESHWLNVDPGHRFLCPTKGCRATVVIPELADLPTERTKMADIHIEKVGDVMTCSISLQGYAPENVQAFVDSLENIVGHGNVELLKETPNASNAT